MRPYILYILALSSSTICLDLNGEQITNEGFQSFIERRNPSYTDSEWLSASEVSNLEGLAQRGDSAASLKLYNYHNIYKKDLDEARFWLWLSAKRGNGKAQHILGRLYLIYEPLRDPKKARYWLDLALNNGQSSAIYENEAKLAELNSVKIEHAPYVPVDINTKDRAEDVKP